MSDRFDNELTSEKGVGKVFDKVRLLCNNVFKQLGFHEYFSRIFSYFPLKQGRMLRLRSKNESTTIYFY